MCVKRSGVFSGQNIHFRSNTQKRIDKFGKMADSTDNCCICQAELVKGSDYRCLNDQNVEIIGRFAKAWMEQGISVYDRCEKTCRKYKEQKFEAVFHVQCYRALLSNAEYLEACKVSSSSSVNSSRNGERKTSTAAHSNGNSAAGTSGFSPGTPRELNDKERSCLKQAALILRERILKIPNGVFNNYSDEPSVYEFFARACYGESEIAVLPLTNQEYHLKVLSLCKAVVAAVHEFKNDCSSATSDEED